MKVDKPWGSYEVLLDQPTYKVKRIIILPEQQLSLQYHNLREEHWTIVEGSGDIHVRGVDFQGKVGDRIMINKKEVHRAKANRERLVFIEVQLGECVEEDIVRLEDQYGRIK